MSNGPEDLARLAKELNDGAPPKRLTVRELMKWFGARRRGSWVVPHIRRRLDQNGLETEPDFSSVYLIDTEIEIRLKTTQPEVEPAGTISASAEDVASVDVAFSDPTYRIGNIASANKPVVDVKPDSLRAEAVTLMMAHDFSQLPVMQSEREVKGMISWASIGKKLVLNQAPVFVRDCMEPHFEISADKSLFICR
jgi:CBS domain-containing protein